MKRINVNTKKSYDIIIDDSFAGLCGELSTLFSPGGSCFIVTDKNVEPLYAEHITSLIGNFFKSVRVFSAEPGESSKNLDLLSDIYEFMLNNGADRSSVIVALGGGVIGDLAGFAAATYMRGIKYVQIPTTLLSQVDSSIGGKTAVDFRGYKNIIGAFYQPDLVYINVASLETLPARQFSSGMAEVIKYGLIADADFYKYIIGNIENIHNNDVLIEIISNCAKIKAQIVEKDENDNGIRETLNFGHTVGHAVESLMQFDILHGEAVALGMLAAMKISHGRGASVDIAECIGLLRKLSLPVEIEGLDAEQIYEAMLKDKKVKSGTISYILIDRVGHAYSCKDVDRVEIINAIKSILKEG